MSTIKLKKKSGRNWGKPKTWEQALGSRRLRKWFKEEIRKNFEMLEEVEDKQTIDNLKDAIEVAFDSFVLHGPKK